ncbi:MAG: glycine/betaine ABC transporter substrate-binding protein [Clostridiales Family XIII bacterium]|jgi:osmoprotectant transport system substrate-binding protein|nr:glycine/betaine ABC transporter substrate-binding protein [Clostridiales Family XIII bacterium]
MKKLLCVFIAFILVVSLSACKGKNEEKIKVKVGSKNFTENLIVAEIYALALEDAGISVERKLNLASSAVNVAIQNGDIDLYPEYTGTGLIDVLKKEPITDPAEVYDIVKKDYEEQFEITWLSPSPANDGQGIAVSKKISDQYGIKTISDLQKNANKLIFASQGEFEKRTDGLPGLNKKYGKFNFKKIITIDNSLKYDLLEKGDADVTVAYTTEGMLSKDEFVLLIDDKQLWPPYNIAPIVRDEILDAIPEIKTALDSIADALTTEKVTELNAKVDINKQEYETVAKEFYNSLKTA